MKRSKLLFVTAACAVASLSPAAVSAQVPSANIDRVPRELDAETIREIEADICFPATSEEYAALGKHAILMLKTSSAISTELPLRSVYVMYKGVRIPLQKIAILDKHDDAASSKTLQVSFYLLPIQLMKVDARVLADFNGERKAFSFMSFSAKDGLDEQAPSFARLDEYDTPVEPDGAAVELVLVREYPEFFR